ncbi:MAG: hypothetical protein H3C59_00145 [Burkholderiaceae bacterium]|nr:hypothetical protein [Burkholderiaceae bacterium]
MRPIDRILACSARVFGLSWPPAGDDADPTRAARGAAVSEADLDALECCAVEGFAAERLMREAHDGRPC